MLGLHVGAPTAPLRPNCSNKHISVDFNPSKVCQDCWFDSTSSRHVGTFAKSFTRNCLYDVMWHPCGCLAAKFDSCNSLLSSVHTLLQWRIHRGGDRPPLRS